MAIHSLILAAALLGHLTSALQVTPNSPCSSFCIDSSSLDISDPNSSNTNNSDISCYDTDYSTTKAGAKFEQCMSCMEQSSFSQGTENDQAWYLYNLRYAFDYCIFAYPNASNIASTPCSTSTACGGLEDALIGDGLNANKLQEFGYCNADGSVMTSGLVSQCIACVQASEGQTFLANFMVALEAGCTERPSNGTTIGLSDTVFSSKLITATNPSATASASGHSLPTGTLVGIAIGVIVGVLVVMGVILVRCKKRRNRRLRLEGSPKAGSSKRSKRRPVSSLHFRCQTHLSPRSPTFFGNTTTSGPAMTKESPYTYTISAEGPFATKNTSAWANNLSSVNEPPTYTNRSTSIPVQTITTSFPAVPGSVHHSPKAKAFSPLDEYQTPASTVSTKSTANLLPLKPYNPADYGMTQPHFPLASADAATTTYRSPTSGSTASPLLSRTWEQSPSWDKPLPSISRGGGGLARGPSVSVVSTFGGGGGKTRRVSKTGSPVESKEIKVNFAGPPSPRSKRS
ncbi:hypothetical protein BX600DRAFT_512241 [Xylariales sp. PMI_506]|nr:hypothetical protein BX600DRAFT_512241 [Xylariales sp. PMI_506]